MSAQQSMLPEDSTIAGSGHREGKQMSYRLVHHLFEKTEMTSLTCLLLFSTP